MFTAVLIMAMATNTFAVSSLEITFSSKAECISLITETAVKSDKVSHVSQIGGVISYIDNTGSVGIISCTEGNERTAEMTVTRMITNNGNTVL